MARNSKTMKEHSWNVSSPCCEPASKTRFLKPTQEPKTCFRRHSAQILWLHVCAHTSPHVKHAGPAVPRLPTSSGKMACDVVAESLNPCWVSFAPARHYSAHTRTRVHTRVPIISSQSSRTNVSILYMLFLFRAFPLNDTYLGHLSLVQKELPRPFLRRCRVIYLIVLQRLEMQVIISLLLFLTTPPWINSCRYHLAGVWAYLQDKFLRGEVPDRVVRPGARPCQVFRWAAPAHTSAGAQVTARSPARSLTERVTLANGMGEKMLSSSLFCLFFYASNEFILLILDYSEISQT